MKNQTPKALQISNLEKYTQLAEECSNKPDKLRAILKQLNDEVGAYLSKKKSKTNQIKTHKELFITPKKEVLIKEHLNNLDILKRLKKQLETQQKRLQILESKTCKQDLENKIQLCEENIKQLANAIEIQKKLNSKQGKVIAQLEDQNGIQSQLNEIRMIEKSIQEYQQKNLQLIELIETEQKKQIQFQEFQSKIKDKVQQKEQQSVNIQEQDPQIEQKYQKLQMKIQNQERHKKVIEEKYLTDLKSLKSDIVHKQKCIGELENLIQKLHIEIIQLNEQCQRQKDYQMKRSYQIRLRLKQSVNLNQLSSQAQDSSNEQLQQVLSHSFTSPKNRDFQQDNKEDTDQIIIVSDSEIQEQVQEKSNLEQQEKKNNQNNYITQQKLNTEIKDENETNNQKFFENQ